MTPTGIELVTCRFVAQYLNQLRHRVTPRNQQGGILFRVLQNSKLVFVSCRTTNTVLIFLYSS
jgi:hypothetical protein